ncbi:Mg2 transporter protein CorA family protein [Methanofollis liminatans DSM 4140]|uniref:Mg2 transporter protein CorA family protein n=1 Tax=Methanofollis liminatans DSM 4140 TaxID=28892 RepID=J1KZE2_9EURY|nr:magnesium transporter CorA family protein [Methanofollis liminatans]EJG06102.1 Mg2 transporter protein CorA family protein [Methanofollis liminatans DSM 4140]
MLQIFKTRQNGGGTFIEELDTVEPGAWIICTAPDETEIARAAGIMGIPAEDLRAALDEEERPRMETEEGRTFILIDIPMRIAGGPTGTYSTIPLGVAINDDYILTICLQESPILQDFIAGKVKTFYTFKKTRFLFQILYRSAFYYLNFLRQIDKRSTEIEKALHMSLRNEELILLLNLEKSLVYFSTSLKSNEVVLEKILRFKPVRMFPEDEELLEDVIIENKQAIEMANIYSNILSSTMDAFASVISNNLNIVMKFLASVTIVLAVPTMIASFFGMNVGIPLSESPIAFAIVVGTSMVISAVLVLVLMKKNMI